MAKRKIDTSQALFTDFSAGLYLLDTPRGLGEQLKSLALVGGRNVWAEKGALVPQYGYNVRATIPDSEKILFVSEDDQSGSSIFIITQDIETNKGNVYLYTAKNGLKQYKTAIPSIEKPIVTARNGNSLILRTAGVNYYFGSYYRESPENVIDADLDISTYTTYYETTIPKESLPYYWDGKEIVIKTTDKSIPVKVISIAKTEAKKEITTTFKQIADVIDSKQIVLEYEFTLDSLTSANFAQLSQDQTLWSEGVLGYVLEDAAGVDSNIQFRISPSSYTKSDYQILKFDRKYLEEGSTYKLKVYLNDNNKQVTVELYKNKEFCDTLSSAVDYTVFKDYYLTQYTDANITSGIDVLVDGESISYEKEDEYVLRMTVLTGTAHTIVNEKVSLVEQTIHTLIFQYEPEEVSETNPNITIIPEVMGFCANRLCISDISGRIYYSGVGVVDNFKQSMGAGFFEGFSDDNSKCLSLEDYYNGVLISKQNGLYFLAFGTDSTESVSTSNTIGISIKKIAQIGQEYAKDHVIIDKQILAYDSNSASIVTAASVNVFGSLVAGKTLVTAEDLNATNFGIPEQKRKLVWNAEAKVLILYYGENLRNGIVYVPAAKAIFPREMDLDCFDFQGFNQGILGVSNSGKIFQDYKKGTIIEGLTSVANFEPIALRDNKMVCASLIEISELNNIAYTLTTNNTQTSTQEIRPSNTTRSENSESLPPMVYSNKKDQVYFESFSTKSKWADKISNCTRVYAPLSGRYGINLSFTFPKGEAFCLAAINVVDFSQGS